RIEEAIDWYDRAIRNGFEHAELFEERAMCLQSAGYDLDAIEACERAIAAQPYDGNLYFMRSLSLQAIHRYKEAQSDLLEAIRLSKEPNARNNAYHEYSKETGYATVTAFYEARMMFIQVSL